MDFNIGSATAILGFFFTLGLLYAVLIWLQSNRFNHPPSKYLSLFLVLCSAYITPFMLGYQGWYAKDGYREFLFFVPFQQLFLIGPVIYVYVKSLLEGPKSIDKKDGLHFVPALLYLGYSLFIFVFDVFVYDEYYYYADGRDKDLANWYQIGGLASICIYLFLSLKIYFSYKKRIFNELAYADLVIFDWIRQFLIALLIIVGIRFLFLLLLPNFGQFGQWFYYYLLFSLVFCFIAFSGYSHTITLHSIYRGNTLKDLITKQNTSATPYSAKESVPADKNALTELMARDRSYTDPTLTLTDLADQLGMTSKQTSALINKEFKQNFNDFINTYRVEEVKRRLEAGEGEQFTILSIAMDCGFNSKTTFNRVFKRLSGETPGQFKSRIKINKLHTSAKS
ncbi:MAG: helix-turn-helix transcriptional regulator [Bacteroidota bacterium]